MIKVTPQGSRSLATGNMIANPASTFLETGPKDELAGADAYTGSASQFKTGAGRGVSVPGGSMESAAGIVDADCPDCADKIRAAGGDPNRRAETLGRRTGQVVGDDLWQALLCGPFDNAVDNTGNRQRQMSNASLWLRSTGCSAENLIGLLSVQGGGIGLNRAELEDRLSSASRQSLNTLSPEFKEEMIQQMAVLSGEDPNAVRVAVANQQTTVSAEQSRDASALSQILSNISGSDEVIDTFDLHAEAAVIGSLLDKSIELGIPQAAELLLAEIDDERVRRQVALNRLRSAAIASELKTVQTVIDNSGQAAALGKVPDLITLITQYYQWGRNTTRDQYPAKRDELIATLSKADANWDKKQRNGEWVSNLEPFSVASDNALTLFAMSDYALQASMAPKYPKTHYRNVARKYHPRAILYGSAA